MDSYVNAASDLAHRTPLIFVILLLAVLLVGVVGGLIWAVWRGAPRLLTWLSERQTADHEHQRQLIEGVRKDAADDVSRSERAVIDAHQQIGKKVEALHGDVKLIMIKVGASAVLLFLVGWLTFGLYRGAVVTMEAAKCEPPCPEGQKCKTAIPRECVEDKKGKEAKKKGKATATAVGPSSGTVRIGELANYAAQSCIGCEEG